MRRTTKLSMRGAIAQEPEASGKQKSLLIALRPY